MRLKEMTPEERKKQVPRTSIFGGKAAPGYWMVNAPSLLLGPAKS